jgi:hypothetical protein
MYNNLTSFPIQSPLSSTTSTDPARVSAPPIHHQLFAATNPPVMRSRVAHHHGMPDQPDRAGMRERRAQSEMTVSKLQRSRGVEPVRNSHAEVLEAYGYRQLAQWVMDMPANVMHAVQAMNEALGDAVSFHIGPLGAQAAPARSNPPSVNDFMKKFSADFEIRLNPAARNAVDMRGMIIVIGEEHIDPLIQTSINKVMLDFNRIRGDRLFLEGHDERVCEKRVKQYQMQGNDCDLLEKNSEDCETLNDITKVLNHHMRDSVNYIKKHVASARESVCKQNALAYYHFIDQHLRNLPASKLAGYVDLQRKVRETEVQFNNAIFETLPRRDQQMADYLRSRRSETGLNYMIMGSGHVTGVTKRLKDLPLIMMVPRALVKDLPADKDEL